MVGVAVGVGVAVAVAVAVAVGVELAVGVAVGSGVSVAVGVSVTVGRMTRGAIVGGGKGFSGVCGSANNSSKNPSAATVSTMNSAVITSETGELRFDAIKLYFLPGSLA